MRLRVQTGDSLIRQFFQSRANGAEHHQTNRASSADGGNENIHTIAICLFGRDDMALRDKTPPGNEFYVLDRLHNALCNIPLRWRCRGWRFTTSHQAKLPLYQAE